MSHSSSIHSLRAESLEAGLQLARRLAEDQLAREASLASSGDMAAHLSAVPPPPVAGLTAQFFTAVAAANGHWRG